MTQPSKRAEQLLAEARAGRTTLDATRRRRVKQGVLMTLATTATATGVTAEAAASVASKSAVGWLATATGKVALGVGAALVGSTMTYGAMTVKRSVSGPARVVSAPSARAERVPVPIRADAPALAAETPPEPADLAAAVAVEAAAPEQIRAAVAAEVAAPAVATPVPAGAAVAPDIAARAPAPLRAAPDVVAARGPAPLRADVDATTPGVVGTPAPEPLPTGGPSEEHARVATEPSAARAQPLTETPPRIGSMGARLGDQPPVDSAAPIQSPAATGARGPTAETRAAEFKDDLFVSPRRDSKARPAATPLSPAEEAALKAELVVLRRALALHEASEESEALAVLSTYDDTFPRGVLSVEADVLRVRVLCSLGRAAEAKSVRRALDQRAPGSPAALRLQQSCAAE